MNGTMTTLGRVKAVIGDRIGAPADEIGDDTPLLELVNGESLDLTDMRISLEQHFDLDIPEEIADDLDTAAKVAAWIETQQAGGGTYGELSGSDHASQAGAASLLDIEPAYGEIFAAEFERESGLRPEAPAVVMMRNGTDNSHGYRAAIRAMRRTFLLGRDGTVVIERDGAATLKLPDEMQRPAYTAGADDLPLEGQ